MDITASLCAEIFSKSVPVGFGLYLSILRCAQADDRCPGDGHAIAQQWQQEIICGEQRSAKSGECFADHHGQRSPSFSLDMRAVDEPVTIVLSWIDPPCRSSPVYILRCQQIGWGVCVLSTVWRGRKGIVLL